MPSVSIRPRSCIADAELARTAVVDLPTASEPLFRTPRLVLDAIAAVRRTTAEEPEGVIVLTLVPVPARRR